MKEKGLKAKFAMDDNNIIGGMIHYIPVEYSMVVGENLYVVCASGFMATNKEGAITGKGEWERHS